MEVPKDTLERMTKTVALPWISLYQALLVLLLLLDIVDLIRVTVVLQGLHVEDRQFVGIL